MTIFNKAGSSSKTVFKDYLDRESHTANKVPSHPIYMIMSGEMTSNKILRTERFMKDSLDSRNKFRPYHGAL